MATPLVRGGGEREPQAWQELEDVFASLAQLARSAATPPDFYRTVLDQSVRALSAVGAVAWLRADGKMQPVAQAGQPASTSVHTDEARRAHEAMLGDVVADGRMQSVATGAAGKSLASTTNSTSGTNQWLLLGPVRALNCGCAAISAQPRCVAVKSISSRFATWRPTSMRLTNFDDYETSNTTAPNCWNLAHGFTASLACRPPPMQLRMKAGAWQIAIDLACWWRAGIGANCLRPVASVEWNGGVAPRDILPKLLNRCG